MMSRFKRNRDRRDENNRGKNNRAEQLAGVQHPPRAHPDANGVRPPGSALYVRSHASLRS
jgi:hypothetical protein